jgi:hypothetical protein
MGCCISKGRFGEHLQSDLSETLLIPDYECAGIMFTDMNHILAGYQPNKRNPCITGIGGGREDGEQYMDTAIRETIEELFNVEEVSSKLIKTIRDTIQPKQIIMNEYYVSIIYDFDDLHTFLALMKRFKVKTNVYDTIPLTLMDLLLKRKLNVPKAEIKHLVLLPFIQHLDNYPLIHREFIEDMNKLIDVFPRNIC